MNDGRKAMKNKQRTHVAWRALALIAKDCAAATTRNGLMAGHIPVIRPLVPPRLPSRPPAALPQSAMSVGECGGPSGSCGRLPPLAYPAATAGTRVSADAVRLTPGTVLLASS